MLTPTPAARYLPTPGKILAASLIAGLLMALLTLSVVTLYQRYKLERDYNGLAEDIHRFLSSYFEELQANVDAIQPLTHDTCRDAAAELTSRAAFNVNVRTYLLVKNNIAFCSSATGEIELPLLQLNSGLDLRKPFDIVILPGTPMLPDKPAIAAWFSHKQQPGRGVFATLNVNLTPYLLFTTRQRSVTGIALAVGDTALTSFDDAAIPAADLPPNPIRVTSVAPWPLRLYIYGDAWPTGMLYLSLLSGLVTGLVAAVLVGYWLVMRGRSGKEILAAMKHNQFFVVYQPVVDAAQLQLKGVEALMRWQHPVAGMISPDAFISYAEAQQLIVPLTRHLFQLIARDAPRLQNILPVGAKLGINIAPGHLHSPEFKKDVCHLASILPVNYFQLVFEITERDMLQEEKALELFAWLHEQDIEIAIDDFGTGHSALIYLERFKLDYLKIDQGFINAIGRETLTSPVLVAVITLAKRLNMTTVAEGVETWEQAQWLRSEGVNYLQGYYFGKPLPVNELMKWRPDPQWGH